LENSLVVVNPLCRAPAQGEAVILLVTSKMLMTWRWASIDDDVE
jgi:hypothetical protein